MTENWAAVARAINERVTELGLRQRELAERSGVSQAIVREIQHHTVQRRRSARTLEALSLALEWHPQHLSAVLRGQKPLDPGQTGDAVTDQILARLEAMEDRLDDITERLDTVDRRLSSMAEKFTGSNGR
ncbi:XRE family transcriptional regulator [Haloechinothrix sp. LS1_15]|uniref:helix-turn-helix domain-containing protein n=1 Tax=Haloechinothrix sp. LS1_15 TaxID=2652248 RepID=UPI0029487560|nr:XRE family transcriptional regulator [Haloechinothrix sp. LS1_15]MDV6012225.1 XRE family transcriptional regulator [Haloechinothrix sp. LS1_15]